MNSYFSWNIALRLPEESFLFLVFNCISCCVYTCKVLSLTRVLKDRSSSVAHPSQSPSQNVAVHFHLFSGLLELPRGLAHWQLLPEALEGGGGGWPMIPPPLGSPWGRSKVLSWTAGISLAFEHPLESLSSTSVVISGQPSVVFFMCKKGIWFLKHLQIPQKGTCLPGWSCLNFWLVERTKGNLVTRPPPPPPLSAPSVSDLFWACPKGHSLCFKEEGTLELISSCIYAGAPFLCLCRSP